MNARHWRAARLAVWERDRGICRICGATIDPAAYHMDHVVARSRGGSDGLDNLQATHATCNNHKSHLPGVREGHSCLLSRRGSYLRGGRSYQLHLYLPLWMKPALRAAARERGTSVQAIIEAAIEEWLIRDGFTPPTEPPPASPE